MVKCNGCTISKTICRDCSSDNRAALTTVLTDKRVLHYKLLLLLSFTVTDHPVSSRANRNAAGRSGLESSLEIHEINKNSNA